MGAYYQAALKRPGKDKWYRYPTWDLENGAKLMEHGYVMNDYVGFITRKLYYKPAYLVWLCDYHEDEKFNWNTVPERRITEREKNQTTFPCVIYVNLNKKEYFSLKRVLQIAARSLVDRSFPLYAELEKYRGKFFTYVIHPLPLLVNSESESAGGGDYHPDYELRSYWAKDLIVAFPDSAECILKKEGFRDVSERVPVEFDAVRPDELTVDGYLKWVKALDDLENAIIKEYAEKRKRYRLAFDEVNEERVKSVLSFVKGALKSRKSKGRLTSLKVQ